MNQIYWIGFAREAGRSNLHHLFTANVKVIMGDLSTTSDEKVIEIARELIRMDRTEMDDSLPMDVKKPLLQTEAPKENYHLDCNIDWTEIKSSEKAWTQEALDNAIIGIDLAKVESLLDFPLIERGPSCKECNCFKCNKMPDCHILFPTAQHFCEKICGGKIGVANCEYRPKTEPMWTLDEIMKREG